jgi:endonuclease YncB( thermonuclease family)
VNRIGRRIILCMLLIAALILVSAPDVLADDLTGQASIIDGDTLEIHGTRIRLWGIDAPESSQLCRGDDSLQYRCGAKAANDLDAFIASRPVSCIPISLDRYRRTVATCSVGDIDLGEWLARNGLALDWPQYSRQKYDPAQREAEHAGRGMWAGSYVEPWLYRVCIRSGGSPSNCSDDVNAHP